MILITGTTGFVGRNLKKYLIEHEEKVTDLYLRNSNWEEDILKSGKSLIHLVGKAHDTLNTTGEEEYFKINRDLTIKVFETFLRSDIRDFFFLSSIKAVADSYNGIIDETAQPNPLSSYGRSKLSAENYLLQQSLPNGKRLFIIRPCMIHGPGNKGNLNLLYNVVKYGMPWPLASFENKRSFLSIDNLSFLMLEIIKNESIPSGIYNVCDDEPLSTNRVVTVIAESLGRKSRFWHVPKWTAQKIAKLGDLLPLPINSERLKKLTESFEVSNQKIKDVLNIEKLPLSATVGLKKTIKSFNHDI
ncbi:MAG: NAD-dependent epimerase/dehydratase family protein [Sphingobacterium sp.]|jgi:nucleoside-diphosphate-sugar epimerase|nr:NAD-dependent epimerase/dehydratase family protein [Sphingobacterium sp.]